MIEYDRLEYHAVVCLVWSSDGDHECVIGCINHVAVVAQNLHEVCVVVCCYLLAWSVVRCCLKLALMS